MVQTYGIVPDNAAGPTRARNSQETDALLDRDMLGKADSEGREGHATIFSCISNLLNTIIGSGEFVIFCITSQVPIQIPFI